MLGPSDGIDWYEERFLPVTSPLTLGALLFTIVVMFSLKGGAILSLPLDVARIAPPLTLYFVIMFLLSFWMGRNEGSETRTGWIRLTPAASPPVSPTVFGIGSMVTFTAMIGPVIALPVMIGLERGFDLIVLQSHNIEPEEPVQE